MVPWGPPAGSARVTFRGLTLHKGGVGVEPFAANCKSHSEAARTAGDKSAYEVTVYVKTKPVDAS